MKKPTVLIVEDEIIVAEDLAARLEKMGCTVVGIASHGHEAIEMADRLNPGLVLMDIMINGPLDGIKTAYAMQTRHDVPVIYLTAHTDPATLARAKLTSPIGYIAKPFNEQDLATQLELALYKHRSDRRLRESEERYRSLFQNNHAVMLLIDPQNGRIIDANPAACSYYGYPIEKMTTFRVEDINTLAPEAVRQLLQSATAGKKRRFYFRHRLADGRIRDVEVLSGPIVVEGRPLLYSIVHDITGRRRAEEALKRMNETLEQQVIQRTQLAETRAGHLQDLAVALIRAEERERERIAHLLHDDLQQILAAAKFQFEAVREVMPDDPLLEKTHRLIGEAIEKSRDLSHELSSGPLKASSLESGMQWIVNRTERHFGLAVDLEMHLTRPFENELLKVFALRGAREMLFNVVKHAGVNRATLDVSEADNCLVIRVGDQGRGFDPAILEDGDTAIGMGLINLRQRASYIKGDLTVQSAPGEGSRFTLTIPFDLEKSVDRQLLESSLDVAAGIHSPDETKADGTDQPASVLRVSSS